MKKKCSQCHASVSLERITEYHLDTIGLSNVWLIDIEGYTCKQCGNQAVFIPQLPQLLLAVASAVIFKNGHFTAQEIQFLRKFFRIKGKDLAVKLGTSEKTVSLWQTGKTAISPSYGMGLRKLFIDEYLLYLKTREDKNKTLIEKLKKARHTLLDKTNHKELLKYQAQVALKQRIAELKSVTGKNIPTFRIPRSSSFVQLRYN